MHYKHLSRRKMISTLGILAGTCCSHNGKPTLSECSASKPIAKANRIPLTFSTYGLPNYSLNAAIEAIAGHKYDGIEINVASTSPTASKEISSTQRAEARHRLNNRGMIVGSLMSHLQPASSGQQHRQNIQRLKMDCALAHELSPDAPPVIQTVLGGKSWIDSRQQFADSIADWVSIAKQHGVVVAVKPHRGHAMSRPSEAQWLITQLDEPTSLRMWYDYSHFVFRDIPLRKSLQESLPIVAGVAVKDAIEKEGKVQFLLPGQAGTIDYQLMYRILSEGQFNGSVCVEVSSHVWKRPGYDPAVALRKSFHVLSSAMGNSKPADIE